MQVTEYLGAGARQFGFMIRGLQELELRLEALNIPFFLVKGDPVETIPKLVKDVGAAALVTDLAVLRLGRQWREQASTLANLFTINSLRVAAAQGSALLQEAARR